MRKVLIYLFLVALIILSANYFYVKSGRYSDDIKDCDAALMWKLDSAQIKNDVIYFGESSNFSYNVSDSSYATICELIAIHKPNIKIEAIFKGGFHARTYKALISRFTETATVKSIIVTLNLRSFGINWIESNLETNLSRANVLYTNYPPILKKFMLSFKAYDNKDSILRDRSMHWHYDHDLLFTEEGKYTTIQDWDAFMFDRGHLNADGTRNGEKCALACHFIKNYAFVIDDNNPRVKDFDAIVEYCKENKIQLILNLLPENVERAKELCGDDLVYLMKQNVNYLEKRYSDKAIFVNNFDLLADSCFIDRDWPTEHYDFYGRNKVARKVAEKL